MEMTKEDFELFIQFKQFMALQGSNAIVDTSKKKTRREKGTGSITKLSGTRKRPFLASITVGYDEYNGKQIQKPLAYFKSREEANKALDIYMLEKNSKCNSGTLMEYISSVDGSLPKKNKINDVKMDETLLKKNDFSNSNCPTFEDVYHILNETLWKKKSQSTFANYQSSFRHFKELHKRKIDTIALNDLQPVFDDLMTKKFSYSTMNNMKILLNAIFNYGIKYDYIEKNYAQFVTFEDSMDKKNTKIPYSKDDIKKLFINDSDIVAQSIIIMIYTGMRPSELLQIKKENIHLEERYMIGGIKTKNGIDRVIPIHETIVNYVKNFMNSRMINTDYSTYLYHYNRYKEEHGFKCTPHSGRHTFATLCNEYGLNEFLVKKIMGHSAKDLTKDVYTHVDTKRLIDEVNKLPDLR